MSVGHESWNGKRYYSIDSYLKQTFGEKIYRLALNGGMTCPNRDGKLGTRGCIFCSAAGSGDFAQQKEKSITEQLAEGNKVALIGFGTFDVTEKAARKGINPQTKQVIEIAARKVVKFKAGAELNDVVK